jgi:hypothetical protein
MRRRRERHADTTTGGPGPIAPTREVTHDAMVVNSFDCLAESACR